MFRCVLRVYVALSFILSVSLCALASQRLCSSGASTLCNSRLCLSGLMCVGKYQRQRSVCAATCFRCRCFRRNIGMRHVHSLCWRRERESMAERTADCVVNANVVFGVGEKRCIACYSQLCSTHCGLASVCSHTRLSVTCAQTNKLIHLEIHFACGLRTRMNTKFHWNPTTRKAVSFPNKCLIFRTIRRRNNSHFPFVFSFLFLFRLPL